jgi:GNAT superfamily N-acetyltransferase
MIDNLLTNGDWQVRKARNEFDDIEWLVQNSARMSEDFQVPQFLPEDPNECGRLWAWAISDHYVSIATWRGRRRGFLLAWLTPHPFNPKLKSATEGLWYVIPHARTGRCGYLLVKAYTEWAREHVDFWSMTLRKLSGDRMLEHFGYIDQERVFTQWSPKFAVTVDRG